MLMRFAGSLSVTIALLLGLLISTGALIISATSSYHLPGNRQGYRPEQPIAYSHRLHAGELGIACLYCHSGAEKSRHAEIPAAATCMNCHGFVKSSLGALRAEEAKAGKEKRKVVPPQSEELSKLYAYLGLDANGKPDPKGTLKPIPWVKIHRLPDYVYFDHRAHLAVGVACQKCHGPIESMERVQQFSDLSMGWCVNCHRLANLSGINGLKVNASTDCVTCHY